MRIKKFLGNIFKGIVMLGQTISILGSFLLTYMSFYRALTTAGMSTILYFIGSVIAFAAGIFGLWAVGTEVK